MKKAEDYIIGLDFKMEDEGFEIIENVYEFNKQDIIRTIKQAQIDAIEATILKCSQEACKFENNQPVPRDVTRLRKLNPDDFVYILKVAEQLKKEIE